ncbi:hypothetical protein LX69_01289 [Breznakibacter xylanolyticus]|uniref:Uncharacterized protein n=1 Tax=Breznakibacter xylanolyticus TaxID=990 RepID=A0A2W7NX69_9BACT|nr:hypothetical protein [Breznakibacter xylanolyticus]PZX17876.1 hypothetical protein LX69_01289 [Breznakibacter xylanolyticus]
MSTFSSIKELLNTLSREHKLLAEMFEKRKTLSYRQEFALELVDQKEERLQYLMERSVIRPNGAFVELDEQFLRFFEQVLEVNEEINTSYIHENIGHVKQNILYYLQESSEMRRFSYLKAVKGSLVKIGRITIRNIIDLKRNIDNTFKTEPNYKVKIAKLENYDNKRVDINRLIDQTELLVTEEEETFFRAAMDVELAQIVNHLRLLLSEARNNLIEIQKQILEYLNQIRHQSRLMEKIRQLKYLKDQFEIRSKTNLMDYLRRSNDVVFETNPTYPLKLSLDYLQSDTAFEVIAKVNRKLKVGLRPRLPSAGSIATEYIMGHTLEEIHINLEEVKNGFEASGHHLFDFVMRYQFPKEVPFAERVTIFCQMLSLYENDFNVTDKFMQHQEIEFAVVYPG